MGIHYGVDQDWAKTTNSGRTHIANNGIVQSGLVFNLDFGATSCYPGTGTTVYDLKNNHNLVMYNSLLYSASDYYGSMIFDGNNDYLQVTGGIPNTSPLALTTNFTIEQTFRPTAYAASTYFGLTNMLLGKGTASTYNYATQVTNDTTVSFIKRTSPESLNFHSFTVPSMNNKVNVISFVVSGGTSVSCYQNGSFIGSTAITGSPIASVDNDPFSIGSLGAVQYTTFTGSYYSCRIYNRDLSSAEIYKNFLTMQYRFGL